MPVTRLIKRALATQTAQFLRRPSGAHWDGQTQLSQQEIDHMAQRILLPSLPVSDEEMARAQFQDRGQKMARQENWPALSAAIRAADETRLATPGGEMATMLLAYGARGDVTAAAEDALYDGVVPPSHGIDALEEAAEELPGDYPTALVTALAHMDIGLAWRNLPKTITQIDITDRAARTHHHFARAAQLLAPHCGLTHDAPSLAAAQCALLAGQTPSQRQVADDYEALIRLDPNSPKHLRAMGRALLPECGGSLAQLELEARRAATLTQSIWGAGGYTWVHLDALALDPDALIRLDAEFFADGMRDILARRKNQHIANLLAAYCAAALKGAPGAPGATPDSAATNAAKVDPATGTALRALFEWVLSTHLQELHPLIWTEALHRPGLATALPSRRSLVRAGRHAALGMIATVFADKLANGRSIAFSTAGMYQLDPM